MWHWYENEGIVLYKRTTWLVVLYVSRLLHAHVVHLDILGLYSPLPRFSDYELLGVVTVSRFLSDRRSQKSIIPRRCRLDV